ARGRRALRRRGGHRRARQRRPGDRVRAPVRRLRRAREPTTPRVPRAQRLARARGRARAFVGSAGALMLDLACLRDGHAAGPSAADTFGWIVGIVFLALAPGASASPAGLARDPARVTRLMALEQVLPRPPAWWQHALRRSDGA